ncbi:MAG: tetratricopeptide repeat protein [Streptosporangiaceae bacterium]
MERLVADQHPVAFGQLLRQLRKTAGLSIEALAARTNLAEHTISDLERGKVTSPREKTVAKLAWGLRLEGSVKERFVAVAQGRLMTDGLPVISAKAPPQTLPLDLAAFAGRELELALLTDEAAGTGGVVSVHAIHGMAGVGKTVLAVHAAHQLAPQFPDGQIFLDLNGHTPGHRPVEPADALAILLETAGADAREIPSDIKARVRLWRNWLAGKRVLILLDDAADSDQVRPLLPGTAGSLVLVTSRRNLTALEDTHLVGLDVLTSGEAAGLLAHLARRPGLQLDDPAIVQIAGLCENLPLALGMLGRRLRHRPSWTPADLAAELAQARDRLEHMRAEDVSVAAAFELSYRDLTQDQRRMFRRLGLHPGSDTDSWAAAALGDIGPAAAERHLQALYDQNMITEPTRGRYRFHDLIREYARSLAASEDPAAERDAAIGRLLDFYLSTAAFARRHLARRTPAARTPAAPAALTREIPNRRRAMAWMTAERLNLQAAADYAAAHGGLPHAIEIPAAMHDFLRSQGHWDQALKLHQAALAAASRAGDQLGEAGALTDLADVQYLTGDYVAAQVNLDRALQLSRGLGDHLGEANALGELGVLAQATGDCPAAEASLSRALELSRSQGDQRGEAGCLFNLGIVDFVTGNFAAAAGRQELALEIYDRLGDPLGKAGVLNALGGVRNATGDGSAALACFTDALKLYVSLGDRIGEAYATSNLGALKCIVGDYADAAADMDQALELYRELGNLSGQADVLSNLGSLQRQTGNYPSAAIYLAGAITLYRDLSDQFGEAGALSELGALQHATGDYPSAIASLTRAAELAGNIGERADEAEALNNLGDLYLDTGATGDAHERYTRAHAIAAGIDLALEDARALEGTGRCLLRLGQTADGTVALHDALALYQRIGSAQAERVAKTLRDQAGTSAA